MALIRVEHVDKSFASRHGSISIMRDITFEVKDSDFVAIVGPSGCGKSESLTSKVMSAVMEIEPCRDAEASCPRAQPGSRHGPFPTLAFFGFRSIVLFDRPAVDHFRMSSLMMMTLAIRANSATTMSGYHRPRFTYQMSIS